MGAQAIVTAKWHADLWANSIPEMQRKHIDAYTSLAAGIIAKASADLQAAMVAGDGAGFAAARATLDATAQSLLHNTAMTAPDGTSVGSPAATDFVATLTPASPPTPALPHP